MDFRHLECNGYIRPLSPEEKKRRVRYIDVGTGTGVHIRRQTNVVSAKKAIGGPLRDLF
jgi:hypothetical protein